jgi:hypothetical protein
VVKLKDIPIICEYPDVFPDDLPRMPLDRDIEFIIELQPGTAPISKRPYRMPPNELAELKIQLQDLLDKGLIRPRLAVTLLSDTKLWAEYGVNLRDVHSHVFIFLPL